MKKSVVASFVALSLSSMAHAAIEPGVIYADSGFEITPLLETGFKYDDNVLSQFENENSSSILTVDPSVNLFLVDGVNTYSFDMGLKTAFYSYDSTDNFLDANLGFEGHFEADIKNRFDLNANADWVTEQRGTGITEGIGGSIDKPMRFARQRLEGIYEYGAQTSQARIAFRGQVGNKDYQNFEEETQYRNFDSVLVGSTLYYSTQAGNDFSLALTHDALNYDVQQPEQLSRDSNDIRVLFGYDWEATALTTGFIKLGYQKKDFSDDGRENFSGMSWEANVAWSPLTYSTIEFATSSDATDPLGVFGDYIDTKVYNVTWRHQWSDQINTKFGVELMNEKFGATTRKDDTLAFSASFDYLITRWAEVSFYADLNSKESNEERFDYDKNIVGVAFVLSM